MQRFFLVTIIVFFSTNISIGQEKLEKMLNKADLIYDENPAESFSLCESAEREAKLNGDHSQDGAISICKARYLILIASFDAASVELNQAILFFENKKDTFNLTHAMDLKALLLRKMGDVEEAHKMQLKVLDLLDGSSEKNHRKISTLLNITLNYLSFGQADSVEYRLLQLESMSDQFYKEDYYYFYQNWGSYFILINDYDRAIQQYELALGVAEKEKLTDAKATCLMYLSMANRLKGNLHKADEYGEESYIFSQENNLIYETSEALVEWMAAKKELGEYKAAFEIQEKWALTNQEIYDLEKIKKVKAIEGQLEIAQKEKQIAEGEIALKEEKLKGQEIESRNARLIGIVLIVAVLLFFTVFIYLKTRKLNATISAQKKEVEMKSLRLEDALASIEDSLNYSKMIQSSMLPILNEFKRLFQEHLIFYQPKDIVSGDFYWLEQMEDNIVLAVGDCTGHGVPGAMVSMVCHEALNKVVVEKGQTDPGKICADVRDIVTKTFKRNEHNISDGMDASIVSIQGNKLLYAGANNNIWIFRDKNQASPTDNELQKKIEFQECDLIEIKADKQPIGHYHHIKEFSTKSIELKEGDKIFLFSDGYADQFGGDKGKKLKASNLKQLIAKSYQLSMEDQGVHLKNIFHEWKGELEQLDDVCIIGVRT